MGSACQRLLEVPGIQAELFAAQAEVVAIVGCRWSGPLKPVGIGDVDMAKPGAGLHHERHSNPVVVKGAVLARSAFGHVQIRNLFR